MRFTSFGTCINRKCLSLMHQLRMFKISTLVLFVITIVLGSVIFFICFHFQFSDTKIYKSLVIGFIAKQEADNDLTLSKSLKLDEPLNKGNNEIESKQSRRTSLKIILYWNFWDPFMGNQPLIDGLCPVTSCIFTSDRSLLNQSHVVLFFTDNETAIDSDWLPAITANRQAHQRFVFATHHGTPFKISSITSPDYQNSLYNNSFIRYDFFNWTMTYRLYSDVVMRQSMGVVIPIISSHHVNKKTKSQHWMKRPSKSVRALSKIGSKKKFIAWFPKRCVTSIRREDYVRKLSQHVSVDVYGKCANSASSEANFEMIRGEYKFYLALEEFWCPDYVTQEFYKALDYDTVPIVLGGADYDRLAPSHSFINALDFPSVEALADYLLLLNENDELYAKYFDWKAKYRVILQPMDGWCDLCRMTHDADNLPPKIYHDIKKWWIDEAKCEINNSSMYF